MNGANGSRDCATDADIVPAGAEQGAVAGSALARSADGSDDGPVLVPARVTLPRIVVLLAICGGVYGAFVLARAGQWTDADAFRVLSPFTGTLRGAANGVRQVLPFVLALFVMVLAVWALRRHRWREVVRSVLFVAASLAVTEVLKLLLPRPGMANLDGIIGNSYPSGHVAVTLALALVAVILSPTDRWHVWLACATGAVVIGVAWCSIVSGAHRPSDVIGSALLVGFLVQIVFWRRIAMVDSRPQVALALICGAGVGFVLVIVAAVLDATGDHAGSLAAGIPGWLLLCAAPAAYSVMLAPTGPLRLPARRSTV